MELSVDVTTPAFASRFGAFLRDTRKARGMRIGQLADVEFKRAALRSVEKGSHALTPMLVSELASRYGAELGDLLPNRDPILVLATGTVATGGMDEPFTPGDVESLLHAYLRLIRRLRGNNEDEIIALRREDLIDIADQLERPRPEIVDRIAVLLGASGAQRRAMVELYLSGASVVAVTT